MALPLIVLRPQPGNATTVARARAAGLVAAGVALTRVEPVHWTLPVHRSIDALLITSANAIRLGGDQLRALAHVPVWCVGEASAAAASDNGFSVTRTGHDGIDDLLADAPPARLLWLAGAQRTQPQPAAGISLDVITTYQALPLPVDPARLAGPAVALVHSAAAAKRLATLAPDRAALTLVTISAGVADAAGDGWADVAVAAAADDATMVALAATLCQKGAA